MAIFRPNKEVVFKFIPYVPPGGAQRMVQFPAFINAISDNHNPSWSENMDIGRADPKMMYQSYNRTISVDFVTAALYNGEHMYYLDSLNALARHTLPTYKPGLGFNGIFTYMEIGNFIKEYGVLTSVDISINNDSPWIDAVPIYINCSISMKVVGAKKPSWENTYPWGNKGTNEGKKTPGG